MLNRGISRLILRNLKDGNCRQMFSSSKSFTKFDFEDALNLKSQLTSDEIGVQKWEMHLDNS